MSGLFGIVDANASDSIYRNLGKIANKLKLFSWHITETWCDDQMPVGLGRTGIGIFNREPQPIFSQDQRYVLFMTGELYHTQSLLEKLRQRGNAPHPECDPQIVMQAFLTFGINFASELEGVFFICIYDRHEHRLILTNDRLGLYPHYIFAENTQFVFSPTVGSILCAPFVYRRLNMTALAEYMRFQQLLGTKTFHENIALFPYGSVGQFDLTSGKWEVNHYWNWDQIHHRPEVTLNEAVEEIGYLLRRAVTSLSSDSLRPGVFLSGGLDSRTIIGLMEPRNPPVISATYGQAGSRDVYYAEKIARTVGSRHHWFDLSDGQWVLDHVDLHLKLTEGFHNWIHLHGINILPELRNVMDYNLTGWNGGGVMGGNNPLKVTETITNPVDDRALMAELFRGFTATFTWPGLTEAEANMLFTSGYAAQLNNRAFESMVQEFKPYKDFIRVWRPEFFYINNHDRRMTGNMIKVARAFMEVRFPYWDYTLIDTMYSYAPHVRSNQRLFYGVITHETPGLSRIPTDRDEFLPTSKRWYRQFHSLTVKSRRKLGIFPRRLTLYADYECYLRSDLHDWASSILFDGRLEQRGIFDMAFVHSLFNRHVSGNELWTIGKIAPIMSFEMIMREFFD